MSSCFGSFRRMVAVICSLALSFLISCRSCWGCYIAVTLSWTLCCRYVRVVVVCVPTGQCRGAALTLLRAQLLRIASEARFIPHLSVQRRHAVEQCVKDGDRCFTLRAVHSAWYTGSTKSVPLVIAGVIPQSPFNFEWKTSARVS